MSTPHIKRFRWLYFCTLLGIQVAFTTQSGGTESLRNIADSPSLKNAVPVAAAAENSRHSSGAPGDEWEYLVTDEMFGKKQTLILRVKTAKADGILEEIVWNGEPTFEKVSGARAAAFGTPNDSRFLFASHWDGNEFADLLVEGGEGACVRPGVSCRLALKNTGTEKLSVAAGTFDVTRLEGWLTITTLGAHPAWANVRGPVTIWYSKEHRRLLKQTASMTPSRGAQFSETIELNAIRPASR